MSSNLGFNISYLEYVPTLQIKIYNMQYIQRKENVNIQNVGLTFLRYFPNTEFKDGSNSVLILVSKRVILLIRMRPCQSP